MKVKELKKKSSPRIDVKYLQSLGIQTYGDDNLYPQIIRDIVNASSSGRECADRYLDFIEGNGYNDIALSEYVVNRRGETMDDIHSLICQDMAMYHGIALHVNYNVNGEITEINHVPFENCRLCEPDDNDYYSRIAIHPDWSGKKTRNGKVVQVKRENIDYIHVFNPNKSVVLAQIEAVGGIEYYQGQVLWLSLDGKFVYPRSKGDKVVTEMSTDEGLANVKYRNVRCNFLPSSIIVTKRANNIENDGDELHDSLVKLQGDKNVGKIVEITIEADEEKPEVITLNSQNYDKEFSVTDASVTERIYSAYGQEPWYCIRIGKIGFSGDILSDAFEYYNSIVSRQQRFVERAITSIFKHWYEKVNFDFTIKPLQYVRNNPTN